ncbi:sensor histidine kinase [Actinocrinis puniceicyclus]|uniref:histidine kinase n=1 Tax=Actinocrinis puniceicyclus TaxID=977794 RepID=A0A8J8BBN0_9ACTN|nr:sensor histidine kinase [Actinocrinis puniceicyclus]MBS2962241.1 sensor histidine kinase [Actinocrinis puniceicyclus]
MSITGHLRGAVRRHPHLADATIALAVFAAIALTTFAGRPQTTARGGPETFAIAAAGCAVLAARRHRPLTVLVVSAAAAEAFLAQSGGSGSMLILLAPAIALYTVADLVERKTSLIVCGVALAALVLVHALHEPQLLGPQNLAFTALGALAIAAGDSSRNRRAYLAEVERRADRAERERERDARRRVAEERLRIARDLHDSVGHHLAIISVQSAVAQRSIDPGAATAHEALGHVKSAGRKALHELRDTISLLRQPGDPVAPTTIPAPGLDALEDLLASLRASGVEVDTRIDGAATALTPAADLTAYRVIQESLTNVHKHSSARRARLGLVYDRNELRITIDDLGGAGATDGRAPLSGHVPTGRHGIVGMRERVLALGGRFTAGPRPGDAFRVTAALPYLPLRSGPERAP